MARKMDRRQYAEVYGPTQGDPIRLGDTSLIAEVEKDYTVYGDECVFGGGKVLRDGMGRRPAFRTTRRSTSSSPISGVMARKIVWGVMVAKVPRPKVEAAST